MYTQTEDGVLASTDQGVSWGSLWGLGNRVSGTAGYCKGFYQRGKFVYATEYYDPGQPARLWLSTNGGMPTPRLALSSVDNRAQSGATAGEYVKVRVRSPLGLPRLFAADSVSTSISFDSDMLSFVSDSTAPDWQVRIILESGGRIKVRLLKQAGASVKVDTTIAWLNFRANLARQLTSAVTFNEVYWDADTSFGDCAIASLGSGDSVQVSVTLSCGDSIVLAHLDHWPLFEVLEVEPNPATNQLRISTINRLTLPIQATLYGALGNARLEDEFTGAEATRSTRAASPVATTCVSLKAQPPRRKRMSFGINHPKPLLQNERH